MIKCFDSEGVLQANVRDWTLAGSIMAILGEGATVRIGRGRTKSDIVYTEGVDGDCAGWNDGGVDDVAVHLRNTRPELII